YALSLSLSPSSFFFEASAPTEIYTLSLHDALPISASVDTCRAPRITQAGRRSDIMRCCRSALAGPAGRQRSKQSKVSPREHCREDRKSTRLNSSHVKISYAVFCLKKKKNKRK